MTRYESSIALQLMLAGVLGACCALSAGLITATIIIKVLQPKTK